MGIVELSFLCDTAVFYFILGCINCLEIVFDGSDSKIAISVID